MTATATAERSRSARAERKHTPLLARPLASYYLVLGTTAMLVILGLVMVLSASSVIAYSRSGSSFSIVSKQALWVGIGLPAMFIASRISPRGWRMLG